MEENKITRSKKRADKTKEALDKVKIINIPYGQLELLEKDYKDKLNTDPKYSLCVDPENQYCFSEDQKNFIDAYVQLKNFKAIEFYTGMDMETCKQCYADFNVQQEIKRINMALYSRQFSEKMLSIDEIGGYLTSVIADQNVPLADQLTSKDKLKAAQLLINLLELKRESYENPKLINEIQLEEDLKDLSAKSIKNLLNAKKDDREKEELIAKLNKDNVFSAEEIINLKGKDTKELLELLEKINYAEEHMNDKD